MSRILKTFLGAAFMATFTANADPLLYWMVSDNPGDVSFQVARVAWENDSDHGYLNLVDEEGRTSQAIASSSGGTTTAATWADLSGFTGDAGYTFFIELLSYKDGAWQRMGQSTAMSYSSLVSNGSVLANSLAIGTTALTAWTPTVSIPEPSSGLLLLMGGSLLALRRRRKVA